MKTVKIILVLSLVLVMSAVTLTACGKVVVNGGGGGENNSHAGGSSGNENTGSNNNAGGNNAVVTQLTRSNYSQYLDIRVDVASNIGNIHITLKSGYVAKTSIALTINTTVKATWYNVSKKLFLEDIVTASGWANIPSEENYGCGGFAVAYRDITYGLIIEPMVQGYSVGSASGSVVEGEPVVDANKLTLSNYQQYMDVSPRPISSPAGSGDFDIVMKNGYKAQGVSVVVDVVIDSVYKDIANGQKYPAVVYTRGTAVINGVAINAKGGFAIVPPKQFIGNTMIAFDQTIIFFSVSRISGAVY